MNILPSVYTSISKQILDSKSAAHNVSSTLILSSASISSAGNALSLVFNRPIAATSGGVTLTASGGPVTVSFVGVGGNIVFYSLSRNITSSETVSVSYTGTTIEDLTGNILLPINNQVVTNLSTVV